MGWRPSTGQLPSWPRRWRSWKCSLDQHAIHLQVADEGGALTLGGLSQCPTYLSGMSKADVQKEFKKQIDVFVSEGLDFLLCEVSL